MSLAMSLNESIVENAAIMWFGEFGSAVAHGPQIAPAEPAAEILSHALPGKNTEFLFLPSLRVRRVEYHHQRKKLERQFEEWQRSQKS
jgi:hypothetical protein